MFARESKQEYDPTSSPSVERPLAGGRPLSTQVHGNTFGGKGLESFRKDHASPEKKTTTTSPLRAAMKQNGILGDSTSPSKGQSSPTKSSLSAKSRYAHAAAFDPENAIWSDEEESIADRQLPPGKSLHRHAKSVTFDAAPPEVNEYEMTTPDPSSVASGSRDGSHDSTEDEDEESFDRGSSMDRDDSFDVSLEDTEKTPVVLPEDWRFMSPAVANEDRATKVDDPFDGEIGSPSPTTRPFSATHAHGMPTRIDSGASDGDPRPLPPLPALGMPAPARGRANSSGSQSASTERGIQFQRAAISPPRPASISKAELQGMGGCAMPIEERLRLMMIQDEQDPQKAAEEQRERRLRRGSPIRSPESDTSNNGIKVHEVELENDNVADLRDYKMPPTISRESILRKVKLRNQEVEMEEYSSMVLSPASGKDALSNLDPDTPLPSTEVEIVEKDIVIKKEDDGEDSEVDVYAIPDLYSSQIEAESYINAMEKLEAIQQSRAAAEGKYDDDESHYSVDSRVDTLQGHSTNADVEDEGPPTPRAALANNAETLLARKENNRMSLPQFAALLGEQDFGFGMESFMTDSAAMGEEPVKNAHVTKPSWSPSPPLDQETTREQLAERPVTPLQEPRFSGQDDEPRTPDSVIRHPLAESPALESPGIPEPVATIKASGSKLKTRPSATPADIRAMAETRRQVSGEVPDVPNIPFKHMSRPSVVAESEEPFMDAPEEQVAVKNPENSANLRQPKRKSSLIPLDIPVEESDELGLGIESELDRVVEAQKVAFNFLNFQKASLPWSPGCAEHITGQGFRPLQERFANNPIRTQKGYLMRQNTKVIVASSASHESASSTDETQDPSTRGTRSAGNSPRKASQTKTWTTEPWNGKIRRKSIRQSGGSPSKSRISMGPAPPLPGQESNVASGLDSVNEDEAMLNTEEIGEDGERGRLFVKVVRVKDLDLPLPKGKS